MREIRFLQDKIFLQIKQKNYLIKLKAIFFLKAANYIFYPYFDLYILNSLFFNS